MSTKKIQIIGSMNADTLDGKHAKEFTLVSDFAALQTQVDDIRENAYDDTSIKALISTNADDIDALEGLVGDEKVSDQISQSLNEANAYTDTSIEELSEGFSDVILQMYSNDLTDDGAPTIRQIANDEANTALEYAKSYTDTGLNNKVDKVSGKGLSTNDYTTTEKNKLAGIAEGANKTVVDTALSSSSTNPVQNKVVNAAISNLDILIGGEKVSDQINSAIANKADSDHTHDGRYYTESEVDSKLNGKSDSGHTHSAYVNQNAFSKVTVGSTTIEADNATDTLTLTAGDNITLTPDTSGDKITIAAKDTVYTHPNSGVTAGTYKSVTVNTQGHVTAGSNPTTLSGYGITDAATKSELNAVSTLVGDTKVSTQISDAIKNKSDVGHTHTAADVGADSSGSAASALASAKSYTDTKISDLINSAPTTLDTLGEIATAMEENSDVVAALEDAVGTKANAADLTSHTGNKSNPHGVTVSQIGAVPTTRTVNGKALSANISLSASDVGADASGAANTALTNAKAYTDSEITEWVGDTKVSEQITTAIAGKSDSDHTHDGRYYTESEIDTKLGGKSDTGHAHSSYVNQNAFSNITVGSTTIAADSVTDTLTLVAGSNVTITPDATNDKVTIAATDTVYTHPSSGVTAGTYKSVTVNAQGHVTGGSNPTTLSGYGITDAATKTHTHTASAVGADASGSAASALTSAKAYTDEQIEAMVGDETVADQITSAIANKADTGHTHDSRYYTESEIDTKLSGKANSSHGNHVPTTETANNAKFLRNDNTWATVTPANIGAAASSHTHDDRYYTESEVNTKVNAKLNKLTYEWVKEYNASGTAGYLLIGSFPMYDSNLTINIDSTTSTTYHGTLVIATQNVSETSIGSSHTITVYDDPTGTISDAIRVVKNSGSRNYNVYFVPSTWSKTFIHVRAMGNYLDGFDASTMCTFTAGTAPTTTSGLSVVNALRTNFNNFTYTHPISSGNKHIPSGGSSGQILRWSADGTAAWGADNNTTYSNATTSVAGLMSASDKSKLDGIASGANNYTYTLPNATSSTLGGVKVGSNITVSSGTISLTKSNVTTALGYTPPTTNTTYSAATTSTAGLMSAADKTKLDGIATGANNYTYTLPTASSTLGGVKTTSTVTSTSGLTACPIISGVPYYKDTNTTYTSLKNPYSLTIQGNGTTLTNGTYDGSAAKTVNITASAIGAAAANHNHVGQSLNPQCLELGSSASGHGGYIDFHYNDNTNDYTSRIAEMKSGLVSFMCGMVLDSNTYGTSLPAAGTAGRVFFKKV